MFKNRTKEELLEQILSLSSDLAHSIYMEYPKAKQQAELLTKLINFYNSLR